MPEIGATLREARMRARIDVSEIEAQTKIRAKYLRALENEEWSLLPGPTFVKSFLRTYAQALDLDGKALVEEYRQHHERPSESALEPIVSTPQRARGRQPASGPSRGYMLAVGVVVVLIVVLIVSLIAGGSSAPKRTATHALATGASTTSQHASTPTRTGAASTRRPIIALSLTASSVVYVCLLGDKGRKLLPGINLQPGVGTATFHARHFVLTLGNSSVKMFIDGRARSVPPSSQPIGYSITKARGRQPLAATQLPTCK